MRTVSKSSIIIRNSNIITNLSIAFINKQVKIKSCPDFIDNGKIKFNEWLGSTTDKSTRLLWPAPRTRSFYSSSLKSWLWRHCNCIVNVSYNSFNENQSFESKGIELNSFKMLYLHHNTPATWQVGKKNLNW